MLTDKRKAEVEKIAVDLFAKYFKVGIPAKKLTTIIAKEGLWFSEIDSCIKFLGALIKIDNDPLHVFVNMAIKPIGRKNFTIAHELGHFILGHHLHSPVIYCNKIKENDEQVSDQEDEATYFARCFLMPRNKLIKEFTDWFKWTFPNQSNIYYYIDPRNKTHWQAWNRVCGKLKDHFAVSALALKIRLVELGLINNFSHKDY